ncbi:restriction endonuclease subunit S [Vibrio antiquarius]
MSCNWPRVQISEVCELIVDCVNKTAPRVDYETPFKMIRTPNVKGGKISLNDCRFVEEDTYEKWTRRAKVLRDDVLLTREAPMGEVGIVDFDDTVFLGQRIMQYRVDRSKLDPHFLLYSFLSSDLQHQFNMHEGSGSVVSHIRVPDCSKFELNLPPLNIQKEIADVLKKLDRKISVNQQTNQTLEQMAQAIFKSWFVDFDPVKAKMNGEQPEGMDEATASLFPDKLVESELGLIPEGWEVLESQKVATVAIGKTPPRKEPQWFSENPSNVTWISIKDMGNAGTYALDSSEYLTPEAVDKFNVKVIPDNTLILSFKLTVGRVAITHGEMTTNEAIAHYKLADDARVSTNFLYSYMKQFNFESLGSTSSIAKAVNSKIIKALPVIVPSKEILDNFDTLVKPLFDKIKSNQMENQNLEALRDTLLPKLLSGEIELGQAQELAEVE